MSHPSHNEPAGKGSSRLLWLLLLLLVLILALVLYDQGGARQFGQKAYSNAVQITHKVSGLARSLYSCGIQGCPEKASNEQRATAPGKMAVAGQETNAAPATPPSSAPATEPQGATPATPEQYLQGQGPGASGSPQYPAYPDQAPDSSFGNREAGAVSPNPTAPMMASPQQEQSFPPPMMAPMQPMPESAPARPEYQEFPQHPSVMAPQMMPPQMMAPMQPMPESAPARPEYPEFPQYPSVMAPPMMPPQMMSPQAANPLPDRPNMDTDYGTDRLNRARGAAQGGYFGESVREYRRHLASYPNDVDAYGELGNVYLKMGRYPEAAQSYYEAAARMIDAGYFDAVAAMMPIIQTHEPMLASLLKKKMANANWDNQDPRR